MGVIYYDTILWHAQMLTSRIYTRMNDVNLSTGKSSLVEEIALKDLLLARPPPT
jgi:hypothetical protein